MDFEEISKEKFKSPVRLVIRTLDILRQRNYFLKCFSQLFQTSLHVVDISMKISMVGDGDRYSRFTLKLS